MAAGDAAVGHTGPSPIAEKAEEAEEAGEAEVDMQMPPGHDAAAHSGTSLIAEEADNAQDSAAYTQMAAHAATADTVPSPIAEEAEAAEDVQYTEAAEVDMEMSAGQDAAAHFGPSFVAETPVGTDQNPPAGRYRQECTG